METQQLENGQANGKAKAATAAEDKPKQTRKRKTANQKLQGLLDVKQKEVDRLEAKFEKLQIATAETGEALFDAREDLEAYKTAAKTKAERNRDEAKDNDE